MYKYYLQDLKEMLKLLYDLWMHFEASYVTCIWTKKKLSLSGDRENKLL